MNVTVITPSIPERSGFLAQCMASVADQTSPVISHAVGVDHARLGPSTVRNRLVQGAGTEWVMFLDDDDLLDRNHIAVLAEHAEDSDVVYSWARLTGRNDSVHFRVPFRADALRQANFIPVTAAVRTSLFREVGGFQTGIAYEDHALWLNLLNAGARFTCVEQVTWTYRWHGGNRSYSNDEAVARGELAAR